MPQAARKRPKGQALYQSTYDLVDDLFLLPHLKSTGEKAQSTRCLLRVLVSFLAVQINYSDKGNLKEKGLIMTSLCWEVQWGWVQLGVGQERFIWLTRQRLQQLVTFQP